MKILGREPAAWLNALSAVIALCVGFGAFGLTETKGQAVIGVASAVTTGLVMLAVRPVAPTLLTGLITSGVAFLAAFNLVHITERQTGLIVATGEILLTALIIRPQSTPEADPAPPTHSV